MLNRFSRILRPPQQQRIGTGRSEQRQLIQCDRLASGSNNPGTRGGGESESGDSDFGDGEQTDIVGDGADYDDDLAFGLGVCLADELVDAGKGDWGAVDFGHEEAVEDDFVEV